MTVEFKNKVSEVLKRPLSSMEIQRLQVNVGYRCNMACRHCHVSSGPGRTEVMERATIDRVVALLKEHNIRTLDITGGAPELNPHFVYLVRESKQAGCHVIARSNLTIFFEDGFDNLPEFYREHDIEITASLPYYLAGVVDRVRGEGTFAKSIEAIQRLNRLGYGDGRDGRKLNLVYNPAGAFTAPEQKSLEEEYRRRLGSRHGLSFDNLYVFSNMPVGRFRNHLEKTGYLGKYLKNLAQSFNPSTLDGLMCRHLISIGWNGTLYDCDFNQALGLNLCDTRLQHIREFAYDRLVKREIRIGDHCYGCTAGQGSSCTGAIA